MAAVERSGAYHIGCPAQAVVAVEDGATPASVRVADVDFEGAPTAAARRRGEEQMKEHKEFKKEKLKARGDLK